MESLGGPPTPAVGWAAGIERLGMLIGVPQLGVLDVVLAVEDEAAILAAYKAAALFRAQGFSTEIVASGSPRKRFDKAAKVPATRIVSLRHNGTHPTATSRSTTDQDYPKIGMLLLEAGIHAG
jgi:histidyl-tRNA synthetase